MSSNDGSKNGLVLGMDTFALHGSDLIGKGGPVDSSSIVSFGDSPR